MRAATAALEPVRRRRLPGGPQRGDRQRCRAAGDRGQPEGPARAGAGRRRSAARPPAGSPPAAPARQRGTGRRGAGRGRLARRIARTHGARDEPHAAPRGGRAPLPAAADARACRRHRRHRRRSTPFVCSPSGPPRCTRDSSWTSERRPRSRRIVAALDGLPLALELAASRMTLLSADALADRLTRRLPMLTGGLATLPNASRRWRRPSHGATTCSTTTRRPLFARLSVFAGGSTLEAVEVVAGEDLDVLDVLAGSSTRASFAGPTSPPARFAARCWRRSASSPANVWTRPASERRSNAGSPRGPSRSRSKPSPTSPIGSSRPGSRCWSASTTTSVRRSTSPSAMAPIERRWRSGLRTAAAIWRFWQERGHLLEGEARLRGLLDLPEARHAGRGSRPCPRRLRRDPVLAGGDSNGWLRPTTRP